MKKCYLYVRVSSDQQIQGDGLDRQEYMLINYFNDNAAIQGFDPQYELIIDEGRSAFKAEHLQENAGLGKFFKQVKEGLIQPGSVLIVESLDRFSRENPFRCVEYISHLDKKQIELHDVDKRLIISRRHSNSLTFATMIAERAYEESRLKSYRIRKGWDKRRRMAKEEGQYMIKNCPPWISIVNNKYEVNDNAKIIREIFDLYLSGIRSFNISKMMNDSGRLINDKLWTGTKVCRVLRNVRCKGDYITNITERNFDDDTVNVTSDILKIYPAIVSEDEFREVQRRLEGHNYSGRIRNDLKKTLFSYVVKCSHCGSALSTSTTGEYTYLKCSNAREKNGCAASMLPYMPFEKAILKHIKDIDVAEVLNNTDRNLNEIDTIKSEIVELESNIDEYIQGIAKRKRQGLLIPFAMIDEQSQAEDKLKVLKELLSSKLDSANITRVEFSDDIHDVKNIEERARLEVELKKVIKRIDILSESKNKFIIADIQYYNDDHVKHVLLINKKNGTINAVGEISQKNGWRTYSFSENSRLIFRVESNGDIWTVQASNGQSIEDIRMYMTMMVGREPDDFDYQINEDCIEWLE
ncbi:recombinase family protein [Pectobacterium sp. A535-S3-A17]|uniref:recombinase family protein n=1 Tax=Pectobacterium quasiaquaticum TaxID=2774015 RepID=UPI00187445C6|nr:recombinase family protein [Pectobacterium quasiaquaticum]MBE5213691.1 recombinase family protein [Pectobacterium quasiaquaticum]MBE5225446.1 recombinase family protein [Pectobacterium quasiaquaticum]